MRLLGAWSERQSWEMVPLSSATWKSAATSVLIRTLLLEATAIDVAVQRPLK